MIIISSSNISVIPNPDKSEASADNNLGPKWKEMPLIHPALIYLTCVPFRSG